MVLQSGSRDVRMVWWAERKAGTHTLMRPLTSCSWWGEAAAAAAAGGAAAGAAAGAAVCCMGAALRRSKSMGMSRRVWACVAPLHSCVRRRARMH